MLEKIIPQSLPYPIRGAIFRAVRTGIAFLLAGVSASIADGSLIAGLGGIVPPAYTPVIVLLLTTIFTGIDKWLRERGLVEEAEANAGIPLSDDNTPSVVDVPPPAVNVNDGDVTPVEDLPTSDTPENEVDNADPTEFDDPAEDQI